MHTHQQHHASPITLAGVQIRTDAQGRYRLNDLHRASGGAAKDRPAYFLALDSTKALIEEMSIAGNPAIDKINDLAPVSHHSTSAGVLPCKP